MLELKHISLQLGGKQLIAPFSLNIAPGEVVTLMGPSGSGKSSLLSFIGGDLSDEFVGNGSIILNGRPLSEVAPENRRIGRLFQDDLLFPHMNVGENLLFAVSQGTRSERIDMVRTALQRADLGGFENRAPHTLSGGQKSRVALMRALLAKPEAILLDEPFSQLDQNLRAAVRDYTFEHISQRQIPCLLVTHDRDDAPPVGRILKIAADGTLGDV